MNKEYLQIEYIPNPSPWVDQRLLQSPPSPHHRQFKKCIYLFHFGLIEIPD